MSWTTATADFRRLISDGPTDRYRYRKRVFGELNGINKLFKTFEFRRITNFTAAPAPLGVFKNGVLQASAYVSTEYLSTGEFEVATAPVDGDVLEASYYVQWFIDVEVEEFLLNGAYWLGFTATAQTPPGLIPAVLQYATSDAYMKMAMRWRETQSETYRLEDAPKKDGTTEADAYLAMAATFKEKATSLRDDYFTRQGRSLQPLFSSIAGSTPKTTPRG